MIIKLSLGKKNLNGNPISHLAVPLKINVVVWSTGGVWKGLASASWGFSNGRPTVLPETSSMEEETNPASILDNRLQTKNHGLNLSEWSRNTKKISIPRPVNRKKP